MAFNYKQVPVYKKTLQNTFPASRRCWCLKYLLVVLVFLVSSASSSEAQSDRCATVTPQPSDHTCSSHQFFDLANSCCMQCTDCRAQNEDFLYRCNATHNAKCVPSCSELQHFSVRDNKCIITDCSKCPGGDCDGVESCLCDPCHSGATCTDPVLSDECMTEVSKPRETNAKSESGSSLNPLGIGLIAIGVVIGIVAFSSCFLLFGVCTTKQRRMSENQNSENSESGLVSGRGFSNSTRSSYMSGMNSTTAFLNNQSMLELLRHSNTPLHSVSSSSSIRSSPKSLRSSPRLILTSPLAPPTPDKLRESGLVTSE